MARPNVGDRYELLVVMGYTRILIESQRRSREMLVCQCDCGKQHLMPVYEFYRGRTKSCGCLKRQKARDRKTHGMSKTKFYATWCRMVDRTQEDISKRDISYQHEYIDRSPTWDRFEGFYIDMFDSYFEGASLDRINPMEGYSKENCRWITMPEQGRNKGKNKRNKTGVTGVHYRKTKSGQEYFVSCWMENGKQKVVLFSIKKFGAEEAFRLACEKREEAILRLIELDIGYTTYHGK